MTRARLRALIAAAFAASLVLLLVLPAGVLGGKATRASDHSIEIFCDELVGDDGTLFLSASLSDTFGVFAGLEAFPPGAEPFVDPASFRSSDEPATGSYVGGALELDIPVVDDAGDPAGSAVIEAALVSAGEPEPISDRFREGNQWFRTTGTLFPLSVAEGSATLPDGSTFDLAGGQCFSAEFDVTSFSTNPTADIERFTANNMNCALIDGDGTQVGNLFADVDSDHTFAFVDAFFFDPPFGATADVDIVGGNISTSLEFIDGETGEPVGVGELNLTLSQAGERFSYVLRGGTASDRVHGEAYDVEGTLTAPGFEPFDLGDCVLADRTIKQIQSPARQPKPTGRAPVNDAPSGARLVRSGSNLSQQTKNAAIEPEEPFHCYTIETEEGPEELPVLKTVWFKLAGTGSSVRFDTAGSGFDTVLAVYEQLPDGSLAGVEDACNDDVPLQPIGRTLQAALTFDTVSGTTYYVQIGGFPDDLNWGSLHLRVR